MVSVCKRNFKIDLTNYGSINNLKDQSQKNIKYIKLGAEIII